MPTTDGGGKRAKRAASTTGRESGNVSYLEHGLWVRLRDAKTDGAFVTAWLALQCRMIDDVSCGLVVLGKPDTGPFAPAAFWPKGQNSTPGLAAAAEMAMAERRGVIHEGDETGGADSKATGTAGFCNVAYPFVVDERLYGVVAITIANRPKPQVQTVARQIQWGSAWVEAMFRRKQTTSDEILTLKFSTALDLVATTLEKDRFQAACNAVATDLATCLNCDRVSIGIRRRGHSTVVALSHVSQFSKRMNLMRAIGGAMDEACDQEVSVLYPMVGEDQGYITRAHANLAQKNDGGTVLTIPLFVGDNDFGAITLERPSGAEFDQPTVDLCESVAAFVGPILHVKHQNDRHILIKMKDSLAIQYDNLLGSRHFNYKSVAAAIAAVVVFFAVAKGDYRITAQSVLEGEVQRAIVAPFEGYILKANVRAGDIVEKDQILAELDDTELSLERLRWSTQRQQRLMEYDQAMAVHDRAKLNIISAQIKQSEAQAALLDEHLARARLKVPFAGIVVSGDLSQSIGAPVQRGDVLFEVAPLDAYRIILKVDEREITDVKIGQSGALVLSSVPDAILPLVIERITPVSETREGRNYFRVEARFTDAVDYAGLRPGMEGIGKITVDERRLIWIWTHKMIDWLRLSLWQWLP